VFPPPGFEESSGEQTPHLVGRRSVNGSLPAPRPSIILPNSPCLRRSFHREMLCARWNASSPISFRSARPAVPAAVRERAWMAARVHFQFVG
jgi:hypothetical protein